MDTSKKESTTTTEEESMESNVTVDAIPPSEEEYLEDNIIEKAQGLLKKKTGKKRDHPGKETKNTRIRERNN